MNLFTYLTNKSDSDLLLIGCAVDIITVSADSYSTGDSISTPTKDSLVDTHKAVNIMNA